MSASFHKGAAKDRRVRITKSEGTPLVKQKSASEQAKKFSRIVPAAQESSAHEKA